MEPRKITALADLANQVIDCEVELPSGERVIVPLRALSEGAVFARRQSIVWPKPPVKDMDRNGPIYDYENPEHLKAQRDANRRLIYLLLLDAVTFEIPGADDDAKVDALQSQLGQYVFSQLVTASSALNTVDEETVANAARSFRAKRADGTPLNAAPAPDAEPVAQPAAS